MIEIEVQNETHQTQHRMRFAAVPRIGEGIRLRDPDGMWASYDVLDVWYQKAEFGDVWMPYLHVRITPGEGGSEDDDADEFDGLDDVSDAYGSFGNGFPVHEGEFEPFNI